MRSDSILLFARNDNPAINGPRRHLFDFSLSNNGDLIELRCGDLVIDSVQYGEGFPGAEQASLSLGWMPAMLNQMMILVVGV